MKKYEYNMLVQDDFIQTEQEVAETLGISRHAHEEIYGHAILSNRLTQEGKKGWRVVKIEDFPPPLRYPRVLLERPIEETN